MDENVKFERLLLRIAFQYLQRRKLKAFVWMGERKKERKMFGRKVQEERIRECAQNRSFPFLSICPRKADISKTLIN